MYIRKQSFPYILKLHMWYTYGYVSLIHTRTYMCTRTLNSSILHSIPGKKFSVLLFEKEKKNEEKVMTPDFPLRFSSHLDKIKMLLFQRMVWTLAANFSIHRRSLRSNL